MTESTTHSATADEPMELNKQKERKAGRTKGNWGNAWHLNEEYLAERKANTADNFSEQNARKALTEWNKEAKRLGKLAPDIFAQP